MIYQQKKNLIVTYHPETLSQDLGINGFCNLINSIKNIEGNFLFTYPNPDPGGETILEKLKEFIKTNPKNEIYKWIKKRRNFLQNFLNLNYFLNLIKTF